MRLEWLEDILAVAETGSLSEAARRRHVTQSAFSRRVKMIEDQLGIELFDRAHKPVTLRPTTAAQRNQIVRLAAELRQLAADLQLGERTSSQRMILASQHALTASLAPRLVRQIQVDEPDSYIRLRSLNFDDCLRLLLTRRADIALVYHSQGATDPADMAYLEQVTLGTERLIPVIGRGHADAATATDDLPVVVYPGDVFFGRVLDRTILPQLGGVARLVPRTETALTLAALELAQAGIGIAWVPRSLSAGRIASGALTDLSGTLPDCALDVIAARLPSEADGIARQTWARLRSGGFGSL